MKAFFQYFFGAGTQQEFALFTPAHFAPIIWMILMILLKMIILLLINVIKI